MLSFQDFSAAMIGSLLQLLGNCRRGPELRPSSLGSLCQASQPSKQGLQKIEAQRDLADDWLAFVSNFDFH